MDHLGELRTADRTAYLTQLFAPAPLRPALCALALFGIELDRIVQRAKEPLAAEVRLQWWRDAIANEGYGAHSGVPLVNALRSAMGEYAWPADTLGAMSEARIHDLYADPFPNSDAFDGYAGEVFATPLQLSAIAHGVLAYGLLDGPQHARSAATAAGYGGVALAAASAAVKEPARLAAGRTHIPLSIWTAAGVETIQDHLSAHTPPPQTEEAIGQLVAHGLRADAALQEALRAVPGDLAGALLPALSAGDTLRAAAARPLSPRLPGPLATQWRLWRAARRLRSITRR
ncbi:MAG: squalene/phytoene synthase family protein [Pseudomonadota bacterium]